MKSLLRAISTLLVVYFLMLHGVHKTWTLKENVCWLDESEMSSTAILQKYEQLAMDRKWMENIMFIIWFFFFLEEEFQQLQQGFMEKHYLEFDDSDENKLSYTAIFNEYVSHWAACCFIM